MKTLAIFLGLFLGLWFSGFGQGNPLFSTEETSEDTMIDIPLDTNIQQEDTTQVKSQITKTKTNNKESILSHFLHKNSKIQKQLRSYIAKQSRLIKKGESISAIIWILLISFLYGIAHSLGPGHNKVVIFSYFIAEKPKIRDGIILGNLAAFIHALSGLIAAFVILFAIKESTSSSFDQSQATRISMLLSFGMIIIVGLFLLIGNLKNTKSKAIPLETTNNSKRGILSMALAIGIVPCPGTMILVSFLATIGLVKISIFAAFFMAAGMGFTISLIGIVTLLLKKSILGLLKNDQEKMRLVQLTLSISGSILIILIGTIFFLGAL
jgi:ABC-type nickel/cobalt efflux system permease component RcnA